MIDIPKGTYFISHAYKDAEIRDQMIDKLPQGVESYIFPEIGPPPNELVSERMLAAVADHDGLIYLKRNKSALSAWVALERDYAIRIGKPVFAYDPKTERFEKHDGGPLDLQVYFSMAIEDQRDRSHKRILTFMQQKRYFTSLYREMNFTNDDFEAHLKKDMIKRFNRGGVMVIFWSEHAPNSDVVKFELDYAFKNNQKKNVVFALLDETPLLEDFSDQSEELIVRIYSNFNSFATKKLFLNQQKDDDDGKSATQRVDDLIVRLYWLIFRNQNPSLKYD